MQNIEDAHESATRWSGALLLDHVELLLTFELPAGVPLILADPVLPFLPVESLGGGEDEHAVSSTAAANAIKMAAPRAVFAPSRL